MHKESRITLRFLACKYMGSTPFTEIVNTGGGGGLSGRGGGENNSIFGILSLRCLRAVPVVMLNSQMDKYRSGA